MFTFKPREDYATRSLAKSVRSVTSNVIRLADVAGEAKPFLATSSAVGATYIAHKYQIPINPELLGAGTLVGALATIKVAQEQIAKFVKPREASAKESPDPDLKDIAARMDVLADLKLPKDKIAPHILAARDSLERFAKAHDVDLPPTQLSSTVDSTRSDAAEEEAPVGARRGVSEASLESPQAESQPVNARDVVSLEDRMATLSAIQTAYQADKAAGLSEAQLAARYESQLSNALNLSVPTIPSIAADDQRDVQLPSGPLSGEHSLGGETEAGGPPQDVMRQEPQPQAREPQPREPQPREPQAREPQAQEPQAQETQAQEPQA